MIYAGGGIIAAEASRGTGRTGRARRGIPVTTTLMGLGGFPGDHPLSLDMLGMHGSVYANYAVDDADLLLALGVRFDDRVTGKVSEFATHGNDRPRRHRPLGDQQDQAGPTCRSSAT